MKMNSVPPSIFLEYFDITTAKKYSLNLLIDMET